MSLGHISSVGLGVSCIPEEAATPVLGLRAQPGDDSWVLFMHIPLICHQFPLRAVLLFVMKIKASQPLPEWFALLCASDSGTVGWVLVQNLHTVMVVVLSSELLLVMSFLGSGRVWVEWHPMLPSFCFQIGSNSGEALSPGGELAHRFLVFCWNR